MTQALQASLQDELASQVANQMKEGFMMMQSQFQQQMEAGLATIQSASQSEEPRRKSRPASGPSVSGNSTGGMSSWENTRTSTPDLPTLGYTEVQAATMEDLQTLPSQASSDTSVVPAESFKNAAPMPLTPRMSFADQQLTKSESVQPAEVSVFSTESPGLRESLDVLGDH